MSRFRVGLVLAALLAGSGLGCGGSADAPITTPTGAPKAQASPPPTYSITAKPAVPAQSQRRTTRPTSVRLPSGATVPVRAASTSKRGLLRVPPDIRSAGWWDGGARLGDAYGTIVLAGHVDSATQGVGPFAALLSTHPGDHIAVEGKRSRQHFAVSAVDLVPKVSLDTRQELFTASGPLRLVLITCAGPFDPDAGGYQDLAVVTARSVPAPDLP